MTYGKYRYESPNIHWKNEDSKLVVGYFCSLGGNINIYLEGNNRTVWVSTYPFGHIHKDIFNNIDEFMNSVFYAF